MQTYFRGKWNIEKYYDSVANYVSQYKPLVVIATGQSNMVDRPDPGRTIPVLCKVVIELKVTERSTMAPVSGILQHPLLFLPNAVFIYVKPANLVPGKRHQNATSFF